MSFDQVFGDHVRHAVEQAVSTSLSRTWRVRRIEDMRDAASHPAAILGDDSFAVFVKIGKGDLALDQFRKERAGLRYLARHAGVLTPPDIGVLEVGEATLLLLEAVQIIPREQEQWRQMGRTLAQIHGVRGIHFGFETHTYWGDLRQDNTPCATWIDFFRERRLLPRLKAAVDSGNLPFDLIPHVERLANRLADLCGPPVTPSLLHGDAHHNNVLPTPNGPVFIDPAVYYGHPEMDLAYLDFFAPVPIDVFDGYREIMPIDPGFVDRRNLWRIPAWLAMVEVDGPRNLEALRLALQAYV